MFMSHYIFHDMCLSCADIAHDRLLKDTTLEERTALSPEDITKLFTFCLNATYLAYKDNYYQQTFGTAMGSPVSVTVANLVMEDVEERALQSYHSPPLFWKRYIDDVCAVEPSITFTMELESDSKIAFLDIEIQHHENGTLATNVFRKKTHTDQYLSFCSHHPTEHKFAVARALFNRAKVICSINDDKLEEDRHITSALMSNGYSLLHSRSIEEEQDQDRMNNQLQQ